MSSVNTKMLAQMLHVSPRAARHLARTYFQYVFGGAAFNERGYSLSRAQADDLVRAHRMAAKYRLSFEQLIALRQMHRSSLMAYLSEAESTGLPSPEQGVASNIEQQLAASIERLVGLPEALVSLRDQLIHFDPFNNHDKMNETTNNA